jgi:ABC-type molybdate transport system permease subunit
MLWATMWTRPAPGADTRRRLLFRTSALLVAELIRPCPLWAAGDRSSACEPDRELVKAATAAGYEGVREA